MKNPWVIVGGLVSCIALLCALIFGLATQGLEDPTPLVVALLAIVSTAVPALMALFKSEQVHNEMKTNGHVHGEEDVR